MRIIYLLWDTVLHFTTLGIQTPTFSVKKGQRKTKALVQEQYRALQEDQDIWTHTRNKSQPGLPPGGRPTVPSITGEKMFVKSCQDNSPSNLKSYLHFHCRIMSTPARMHNSAKRELLLSNEKRINFWNTGLDLHSRKRWGTQTY